MTDGSEYDAMGEETQAARRYMRGLSKSEVNAICVRYPNASGIRLTSVVDYLRAEHKDKLKQEARGIDAYAEDRLP